MNIKKYILAGVISLTIFGAGAYVCFAESEVVTVDTPELDYYWNNSRPANAPSQTPNDSGWQHALGATKVTVHYNIGIKNTDTGDNISCGSEVPSGTNVTLTFPPPDPTDISYVGTGGSSDSPYGSWVENAAPTEDISCLAKDFTNNSTQCGGPWGVFTSLVISPPAVTITNASGVSCDNSSACGMTCGSLSGSFTSGYSMDCTLSAELGLAPSASSTASNLSAALVQTALASSENNSVALDSFVFRFSTTTGQFFYRYSGLSYEPPNPPPPPPPPGDFKYKCESGSCNDVGAGNGDSAASNCGSSTACDGQDYKCDGKTCTHVDYNTGDYIATDCGGVCGKYECQVNASGNDVCTDVGTGNGSYSDSGCSGDCPDPADISYDCVNNVCENVGPGKGIYPNIECDGNYCGAQQPEMDYGCVDEYGDGNWTCQNVGLMGNYADPNCGGAGACTPKNYVCNEDVNTGDLSCDHVDQDGDYKTSNCDSQCGGGNYNCVNDSCKRVTTGKGFYPTSSCNNACGSDDFDCLKDYWGHQSCQYVGKGKGSFPVSDCKGVCPDRSNWDYECVSDGTAYTCQPVTPGSGDYQESDCKGVCSSSSSYNYKYDNVSNNKFYDTGLIKQAVASNLAKTNKVTGAIGLTDTKFTASYYNTSDKNNGVFLLTDTVPTTPTDVVPGGCWGNNVPLDTANGDTSSGGCSSLNHPDQNPPGGYVLTVPAQSISCTIKVVVDPACGTANQKYPADSTSFGSDTFCANNGTANPQNPDFPTADNPKTTWTCPGINGGTTANCSASLTITAVNGNCGTASKAYSPDSTSFGTDSLCTTGNPSPTSPDFPTTSSPITTWTCLGSGTGTDDNCTATLGIVPINGDCGSADGMSYGSAPTDNLCSKGTPSTVYGSGPWYWSCLGSNGGSDDNNCSANYVPVVNGICGYDDGIFVTSEPTDPLDLCYTGTSTSVEGGSDGPWTWGCLGSNGGSDILTCKTIGQTFNGTCGPAHESNTTTEPTDPRQLCDTGYPSDVLPGLPKNPSGNGPWAWICWGAGTGGSNSCSTYLAIDGKCGSADGKSYDTAPTDNLCSAGSPTTVSGSGPWTWYCSSPNGGEDSKQCTATVTQLITCGTDSMGDQDCGFHADGTKPCTFVTDCTPVSYCVGQTCSSDVSGTTPCDTINPGTTCLSLYHCDNGSCNSGWETGETLCDPGKAGSDCQTYCEGGDCIINGSGKTCNDYTDCQSYSCGYDQYGNGACMVNGGGSSCTGIYDTNCPPEPRHCGFNQDGSGACILGGGDSSCTDASSCSPATVSNLNSSGNYCGYGDGGGEINFSWSYPSGISEQESEVQVSDMSDFSDATFTGVSLLNGNSVSLTFPTGSMIGFGNTYWWRVRVCTQSSCDSNSGQGYSDWIAQDGDGNALTFTTPDHPFPWANFSYLPLAPIVGTAVSFLDGSTCYGSDQGCTYKWDLGDGTITTDVSPIHPYALKGSKTVNLTVCDEDLRAKYSNPCCPADPQTFTVRSPLGVPEYKEVSPF